MTLSSCARIFRGRLFSIRDVFKEVADIALEKCAELLDRIEIDARGALLIQQGHGVPV